MRALRNALFSNLGLRKFQNSFLHLIFRYLNSARDFLHIDINFNVKFKCYDVSYFYQFYYHDHLIFTLTPCTVTLLLKNYVVLNWTLTIFSRILGLKNIYHMRFVYKFTSKNYARIYIFKFAFRIWIKNIKSLYDQVLLWYIIKGYVNVI